MTSTGRLPRVSAVMATRNRAHLLPRAIDSVLSQSLADLELVVVSDASTDDTAAVLQTYTENDPRVRPVLLDVPHGAPGARNAGIAAARGEFTALLDDDAEWLPGKLDAQLEAIASADRACVGYCDFVRVGLDGSIARFGSPAAAGQDAWRVLLSRTFIDTSCLVVRTNVLHSIGGFDDKLPRLQDWDLAIRLAREVRFAYVPTVLVRSYESAGSISSSPDRLIAASHRMIGKLEATGATAADIAALHRALAHALMTADAFAEGRRLLVRALKLDRFSPAGAAMLISSAFGAGLYRRINSARLTIMSRNAAG
ncbi:MAG: glycosyltransferase family 2 protein [Gemmatimonadetes bacterium]|nr:glycosyltransferase family 2 protein [Gemmatimonadota bacterium]